MIWKLSLILTSLLLVGCAKDRVKRDIPPQVVTVWRTFDCGIAPARDPIKFKAPQFRIVDGRYTLTADQYAVLGENMGQIIKATGQLIAVVNFYEQCIANASE